VRVASSLASQSIHLLVHYWADLGVFVLGVDGFVLALDTLFFRKAIYHQYENIIIEDQWIDIGEVFEKEGNLRTFKC
ncbi:MAG: hypothetical protein JWQ30_1505, partial [Sediminibacterium sp.]|nr:hypothetical protein [Sediminibacterium sp.]